jgi:negative regulator of flagellin synthesis FlgM
MKISNDQIMSNINQFKQDPAGKGSNAAGAGKTGKYPGPDRVDISVSTAEVESLKKTMQGLPDVQSDKVARLRNDIATGTYQVSGKLVAEKMLNAWSNLNG